MEIESHVATIVFLAAGIIAALFRKAVDQSHVIRLTGVGAAVVSVVAIMTLRKMNPATATGDTFPFTTLAILEAGLTCLGFMALPRRVLERRELPLIFIIQGLLIDGLFTAYLGILVGTICAVLFLLSIMATFECRRHTSDIDRRLRLHTYVLYSLVSFVGLLLFLYGLVDRHGFDIQVEDLAQLQFPQASRLGLGLALMTCLAVFPFHSWFPLFLSTPRLNLFVPFFVVQLGILLLARILVPLASTVDSGFPVITAGAAFGVVYFALLLFGETRMKRIVGYLILSHVSLAVLVLLISAPDDPAHIVLDIANVLISGVGLLTCLSIIMSRFGLEGVASPSGLAKAFPEVAICFLVCSLSLVGFPGTLGFMSEEAVIASSAHTHFLPLVLIVTAVALNGYSCFRLFARTFFGTPVFVMGPGMELTLGERSAIRLVVLLLLSIRLIPHLVVAINPF